MRDDAFTKLHRANQALQTATALSAAERAKLFANALVTWAADIESRTREEAGMAPHRVADVICLEDQRHDG